MFGKKVSVPKVPKKNEVSENPFEEQEASRRYEEELKAAKLQALVVIAQNFRIFNIMVFVLFSINLLLQFL